MTEFYQNKIIKINILFFMQPLRRGGISLNAGKRPPLWFWRTTQGEELDLLIEIGPQRFLAVECKVAAAIERRHLKGFGVFEEIYGPAALHRGAAVRRTEQPYLLTEHGRIAALPLGGTRGLCQWIGEQIAV